jgi:hypothetical protein
MTDDDKFAPLLWPAIGLAFLVLLGTVSYCGWSIPFPKSDPPIPAFVWHIAEGTVKASNLAYLVPAILIGLGASLGPRDVLTSVKLMLPGIAVIALFLTLPMLWQNLGGASTVEGGEPTSFQLTGLLLGTGMLAFFSFLLIVKPLLIGAAAIAVVVHFVLSLIDETHGEWLYDNNAYNAPSGQLFDMGVGAAVILFAVWSYGGAGMIEQGAWDTPEDVVAALTPPYKSGPWSKSAKGQERMRIMLNAITSDIEDVAKAPCDIEKRRDLRIDVNTYFKKIRIYEDWQVGRPLTTISQRTLDRTADALKAGYLSWDELHSAVRIHFDEERDRPLNAAAHEQLACG